MKCDIEAVKPKLKKYGQEHLLKFYDNLDENKKEKESYYTAMPPVFVMDHLIVFVCHPVSCLSLPVHLCRT